MSGSESLSLQIVRWIKLKVDYEMNHIYMQVTLYKTGTLSPSSYSSAPEHIGIVLIRLDCMFHTPLFFVSSLAHCTQLAHGLFVTL
jgi:hypothetical protein